MRTRLARTLRDPLLAAALAAALVAAGAVLAWRAEDAHRDARADALRVQAEITAAAVTAALVFNDVPAAQEYVAALRLNPQVEAAAVYDADGAVVARQTRGEATAPDRAPDPAERPRGAVEVVAPVTHEGVPLGSVWVRAAPEGPAAVLARHTGAGLLMIMAILALGVIAVGQRALARANREVEAKAAALAEALSDLRDQVHEREKAEEALRQTQKMEAIGRLTGGVAHDFNNLLMAASSGLDLLDRTKDPKRRERLKEGIRQAVDRGASLTRQLLAFSRRTALTTEVVDLRRRIEGMRVLLERSLRENVTVDFDLAQDLRPVEVDPGQLEITIVNLAVNARDAMPDGGRILITARNLDAGGQPRVEVTVSDTGVGIPPDALSRVFEPFYTTKDVGKGTGLGLAQVYGFVQASGGEVGIDSEPGRGTTVRLVLPASAAAAAAPPEPLAEEALQGGEGRILLVEDDDSVAALVTEMLHELGYRTVRRPTARSALDLLERDGAFDLVFSDMVMPGGLSGIDLADRLADLRPGLPVLLTTGYSEAAASASSRGLRLLLKPYRIDQLAAELRALIPVASKAVADG